jgi:hypothetical protein
VPTKTGWLEKWQNGRLLSMVEVQYGKARIRKTPRKKVFKSKAASYKETELYYVLDKNVNLGQLALTGETAFSEKEFFEVGLYVIQYQTQLRLLGKITRVTTFMELKTVLFRGDIHFSAVNKEDFDRLIALDDQRKKEEAARTSQVKTGKKGHTKDGGKIKITFKRS